MLLPPSQKPTARIIKLIKLIKLFGLRGKVGLQAGPVAALFLFFFWRGAKAPENTGTLWNFMELYGTFWASGKSWSAGRAGCCLFLLFFFWRGLVQRTQRTQELYGTLWNFMELFGLRGKVGLQAGPAAPQAARKFPELLPKQCVNFACCSPQKLTQKKTDTL